MATKGILIFNWEGKPIISMDLAYPFKHKPRDINQTKSTMNKYKIGDTVWTRKRGKGRIVGIHIEHTGYRPWLVIFEGMSRDVTPKAYNLYPSEAAMEQAIQDKFIRANPILCGWNKAFTCGLFDIKPDPIQPKFKVGDAVYYKGKKYTIRERYWSGEKWKYNMTKPIDAESGNLLIGMNESDLRLWKETVLTHCLQIDGKTWYESDWEVLGYKSIKYLGNIVKHDTFLVESHGGNLNLFRGIKGDDI